ncbi:hypothetical protein [Psychromonas ingrahamii]|uniref:hypothetical protein n=1 Tax=Psychromonas ingrahamii TaxID=357794 RepID=UPI0018DC8101|nr:hypothetical protein [Psychromonas ingrahamii]
MLLIPLLLSVLAVFITNFYPKYEAMATIYPVVDSVGDLNKSALKKMERNARRLMKSMYRQKKSNSIIAVHEKFARLKSIQLTKQFIIKYDLKKLLFEDKWDTENQRWRNSKNKGEPSLAKAAKNLNKRFKIKYTKKNNLINIKLVWKDPVIAAQIVNDYIYFANSYIADELKRIQLDELYNLQRLIIDNRYIYIQQELITQYEAKLTSMYSSLSRQFKVLSPAYIAEEPIFKFSPILIALVFLLSVFCVFLFILLGKESNKKSEIQFPLSLEATETP